MTRYLYDITAFWRQKIEPPEIAAGFLRTLDDLNMANPLFSDWGVSKQINDYAEEIPDCIGVPLSSVSADMTAYVEEHVTRDDWGDPEPENGYFLFAGTGLTRPPDDIIRQFSIAMELGGEGSQFLGFEVGDSRFPPDLSVVTYPIFKAALTTFVSIWPCDAIAAWATAREDELKRVPHPVFPGSDTISYTVLPAEQVRLPWFCYLSGALAAKVAPASQLVVEPMPDGGLLLIAVEDRLDLDNPDHVARARLLDRVIDQLGVDRSRGVMA